MCLLLQYLCDCQVRHRIEAIVAFSDDFVAKLQDNQRFRYNEVMQALNMSAALTARKTKEFRSPPQEQVPECNWRASFSFWSFGAVRICALQKNLMISYEWPFLSALLKLAIFIWSTVSVSIYLVEANYY